jgi:hypothetical protein
LFKALLVSSSVLFMPLQCDFSQSPANNASVVNAMAYSYGDQEPAIAAFRLVAADRGWTPAAIDAWEPFADDVMRGESGYCWNLRRGAKLAQAEGCVLGRQGRHSDSGFGQVIRKYHYGPGKHLCVNEGLCSAEAVIATPYSSMTSLVATLERMGKQPWCFNAWARKFHPTCKTAPSMAPLDGRYSV